MDFPEILETCAFVEDSVQMRQNIKLLLQNMVGSFAQGSAVGALFDVHTYDFAVIHSAIYQTLSSLPIEITSVSIYPPVDEEIPTCRISLSYIYNNEMSVYKNFD